MPITNSKEKFVHELADMYDAEHQFLEAMGKMRDMASDQKLRLGGNGARSMFRSMTRNAGASTLPE